jgi:hypothetical protein
VRKRASILSVLAVWLTLATSLVAAGGARAATAGILPPRNPAADCDRTAPVSGSWGVANIDACRAREGVGALALPSNWQALTPVQQGFVLINLERVNRGLVPIVGLSATLNGLATQAAASDSDPSFPTGSFAGGGAIWAGASSILAADYLWMYDDGPNGFDSNLACPAGGGSGCWGHRDIILWNRTPAPIVAGGGYAADGSSGSFAYLILSGYSTANLTFTWAGELRYFARKPRLESVAAAAATATRGHHKRRPARRHRDHGRHRARPAGGGLTITIG